MIATINIDGDDVSIFEYIDEGKDINTLIGQYHFKISEDPTLYFIITAWVETVKEFVEKD